MTKLIVQASKDFRLEGETIPEFSAQYKKLTDKDKADLIAAYKAQGVEIEA